MPQDTISGTYAMGFSYAGSGTLTNQGSIGGSGLDLQQAATALNFGTISGTAYAITLQSGGFVGNQTDGVITSTGNDSGGISIRGGLGTVTNSGTIDGTVVGVYLAVGGSVTNQMGGIIASPGGTGTDAIFVAAGVGTVQNAGALEGNDVGIRLNDGGSIANSVTGTIASSIYGIFIGPAPGSVVNAGYIGDDSNRNAAAVRLASDGAVTNVAGGVIDGGLFGVQMFDGGSVTNQSGGTISSALLSGGAAVALSNGGTLFNQAGGVVGAGTIAGVALPGSTAVGSANGVAATVVNAGSLVGQYAGVYFFGGGLAVNNAGGTIGGQFAVWMDQVGTVINAGTISGGTTIPFSRPGHHGVDLLKGGSVTNSAGGLISGLLGVVVDQPYGSSGTIVNAGTIAGLAGVAGGIGGVGVEISGIENLTNLAGATISGYTGLTVAAYFNRTAPVVTNAGTIIATGTNADAVALPAGLADLLVVDPGAVFSGEVTGGNTIGAQIVSTLELAAGASAGILEGLGSQFVDFGVIALDPGATWFVASNTAGLAGTISGFAAGDTIDVTGITVTGSAYAAGVLTLTDTVGTVTLDLPGSFSTSEFVVTNVGGGAEVSLPCFRAGTLIRTRDGDVAVEQLRVGQFVQCAGDRVSAAITWLGHRTVHCAAHPRPHSVWPVRISAGAFGPNKPSRHLFLSPEHAVYAGGVLIPIRTLINGATIRQEPCDAVTYWHIELGHHSVLLAEGLPCETYLDNGNRGFFANGGPVVQLHPDFAVRPRPDFAPDALCEAIWDSAGFAKLRVEGPAVRQVDARLRRRAAKLGHRPAPKSLGISVQPRQRVTDLGSLLRPSWYLSAYPDVAAAGLEPHLHYDSRGWREGRLPCPAVDLIRALGLIDPLTVAITMPDVVAAGVDPVEHFLSCGWRELRRPNAYFDTGWYLDTYQVPPGENPLLHYVLTGERLGLAPSRHLDANWYRKRHGLKPRQLALAHYLKHRRGQLVSPLPSFDAIAYTYAHGLPPGRDPYAHALATWPRGTFVSGTKQRVSA
jgi:hypothetical protein